MKALEQRLYHFGFRRYLVNKQEKNNQFEFFWNLVGIQDQVQIEHEQPKFFFVLHKQRNGLRIVIPNDMSHFKR